LIFSTILPGVRNLRAPLAAGYLWILFACLLAHLGSNTPHSAFGEDLVRVGKALSPVGLAVAVSFIAYLVGSFSKAIFDDIGATLTERIGYHGWARLSQRGHDVLDDLLASRVVTGVLASPVDAANLASDIIDELDLVKTRLLDSKRDYYEEIDRLHAEADLRLALLPPLLAVGIVAVLAIPITSLDKFGFSTVAGKGILVFGVVFLIEVFAIQALNTSRRANDKILDALLLEQVSAPAMDRWEREVSKAAA
jgi:hypothetical protein